MKENTSQEKLVKNEEKAPKAQKLVKLSQGRLEKLITIPPNEVWVPQRLSVLDPKAKNGDDLQVQKILRGAHGG